MHAGYQIIIQVLQLAYTTQACISNLRNLCNASKHMTMHISNATNQSSWACSSYLCASLVQEFDPSLFFNVAPSLSMSMSNLYFFVSISPKAFISLYNLSSFVINFYKRCASHWCKGLHWGRWLRLESLHFYGHYQILEWHHLYSS